MKIFYHNDADGKCAAYVIADYYGHNFESNKEDYIEMDYGKNFPFNKIKKDEAVYILDYSIETCEMDKLFEITSNVYWIDHHKTANEKYMHYSKEIKGIRDTNFSGCVLIYLYLHNVPIVEIPMAIRYIGDIDIWKWEFKDETRYFSSGSELYNMHPLSSNWDILINNPDKVKNEGKIVEKYKKQRNKEYLKAFSYETIFEGFTAIVCNIGMVGSELFGDKLKENDIGITYVFDGKEYRVSLRSLKIDVSKIAVKYGGGGHPGASGFQCKKLPWIE